jgi:hypothetical protein
VGFPERNLERLILRTGFEESDTGVYVVDLFGEIRDNLGPALFLGYFAAIDR